jgi:hypothetical protein
MGFRRSPELELSRPDHAWGNRSWLKACSRALCQLKASWLQASLPGAFGLAAASPTRRHLPATAKGKADPQPRPIPAAGRPRFAPTAPDLLAKGPKRQPVRHPHHPPPHNLRSNATVCCGCNALELSMGAASPAAEVVKKSC